MSRNKQQRYADLLENNIVVQAGKPTFDTIKGNWNKHFFKNTNPIVVEFGCGKGEYCTNLALQNPDTNYIGVDIKGGRLWMGCKEVEKLNLKNVGFLRTNVNYVNQLFDKGEISEIWITFPDPQPKEKQEKNRLTNPKFLQLYKEILKPNGTINFKTDNSELFDYSLEKVHEMDYKVIHATKKLYISPLYKDELCIKTTYEKKFNDLGFNINYLKFQVN